MPANNSKQLRDSVGDIYESGMALLDDGKWNEAVEAFQNALAMQGQLPANELSADDYEMMTACHRGVTWGSFMLENMPTALEHLYQGLQSFSNMLNKMKSGEPLDSFQANLLLSLTAQANPFFLSKSKDVSLTWLGKLSFGFDDLYKLAEQHLTKESKVILDAKWAPVKDNPSGLFHNGNGMTYVTGHDASPRPG